MLIKPLPEINHVFAMVLQQERQMLSSLVVGDYSMFFNQAFHRG